MNVLMVASECVPLVKTGGLADVVGALPHVLAPLGVKSRTMLPAYAGLRPNLDQGKLVATYADLPGGPGRVVALSVQGTELLLLDAPQLFDRPGQPYSSPEGLDWPDNHLRFGSLAKAAARVAVEGAGGWTPDVVHVHDWQAALVPAYIRQAGKTLPPTVLTIHNIAFQGRFGPQILGPLGLPTDWFNPEGLEFYGDVSFLKAGLVYSDRITTVSPTYAREILTPAFGMGLEGVLQARAADLSGILNGIDTEAWDPAADPELARTYDARSIGRKAANRAAVCEELGLDPDHAGPLFCVISRLTEQKGLDALAGAVPHLVARGGQLAVLGTGAPHIERAFIQAAAASPDRIGVKIGYDEGFAHLLQAGADAILIPSRFEPCGLTQLYGLRYGTLPVVARTGGLADTVIDANPAAIAAGCATGFVFDEVSVPGIEAVLDRVTACHADRALWRAMTRAAMRQPVGWDHSAAAYASLYRTLVK